jgi:ferric-dicitrate binding protein FerR (iron transport regulator)
MKPNQDNIDEILESCFPSASKEQIESARGRLYDRVQSRSERDHEHRAYPGPSHSRWRFSYVIGAMAAFVVGAVIWLGLPDHSIDAVLETADGYTYRTAEGKTIPIDAGERIRPGEIVRSSASSGGTIALGDGSQVEMRAGSELWLERADDDIRIHLKTGSVIVSAARQAPGRHLYVQTKDVTVSVVGTIFLVKADDDGSRVAVIEGAVRVLQGTQENDLQPGEQLSSNAKLEALALQVEVGWSRQAAAYLALLHQALAKSVIARQTPSPTAGSPTDPVSKKPRSGRARRSLRRQKVREVAAQILCVYRLDASTVCA